MIEAASIKTKLFCVKLWLLPATKFGLDVKKAFNADLPTRTEEDRSHRRFFLMFAFYLVRQIEDHEIVYDVMRKWAPGSNNSFKMIEDITKYDLFNEPAVSYACYLCLYEVAGNMGWLLTIPLL